MIRQQIKLSKGKHEWLITLKLMVVLSWTAGGSWFHFLHFYLLHRPVKMQHASGPPLLATVNILGRKGWLLSNIFLTLPILLIPLLCTQSLSIVSWESIYIKYLYQIFISNIVEGIEGWMTALCILAFCFCLSLSFSCNVTWNSTFQPWGKMLNFALVTSLDNLCICLKTLDR